MNGSATLAVLRSESHFSFSAINTFLTCPRRYELQYLLDTPPAHRSAHLSFGSAMHRSLAVFYRGLMEKGIAGGPELLQQVFSDAWKAELHGEIPVLFDDKESQSTMLDKGITLVRAFHAAAERPHRVVAVEEPFSVQLAEPETGVVIEEQFVGVLDAVIQQEDGRYRVLEHKTAARRWSKDRRDFDLQITGYGLASGLIGLSGAQVTVQLLLKGKQPDLEVIHTHRTERDRTDFVATVSGVLRAIRAGVTYPTRGWQCRSCPFAGPCVAG